MNKNGGYNFHKSLNLLLALGISVFTFATSKNTIALFKRERLCVWDMFMGFQYHCATNSGKSLRKSGFLLAWRGCKISKFNKKRSARKD